MCTDCGLFSQLEQDKPYGNGVFQAVLADSIFKGNNSIAYKIRDRFCSSLEELEDELEIPKPMLAFIATGVYLFSTSMIRLLISSMRQLHVVIAEWETGTQQSRNFTAATLAAIYKKHLSILDKFAQRKPKAYHKAMAALFTAALYDQFTCISFHAYCDIAGEMMMISTATLKM